MEKRKKEKGKKKRHDNPEENVTFTVNDKFDTASLCTILVQVLYSSRFSNEFSKCLHFIQRLSKPDRTLWETQGGMSQRV